MTNAPQSTHSEEHSLFEANYFSPASRASSTLNTLHLAARYGPLISSVYESQSQPTPRISLAQGKLDFSQVKESQITPTNLCTITERPKPLRTQPSHILSKKRAVSEESHTLLTTPNNSAANGYRSDGEERTRSAQSEFVSARRQLQIDSAKQGTSRHAPRPAQPAMSRAEHSDDERIRDPYFGGSASAARPVMRARVGLRRTGQPAANAKRVLGAASKAPEPEPASDIDARLKNIDPRMVEMIESEILTSTQKMAWDDIAGLTQAKRAVHMAIIYPLLKPELFQGIRSPPKGMLLFGPPGTGKTLIGKCIASQAHATFFNISASSLTSKWIGEGEKMVRALFAVARVRQPTVIFIDEVDSLLTQRTDGEQEATRRIKTEFLVQLDGCGTHDDDRIVLIGATNRPHELDEAARRRFPKRLYIPLPDCGGRRAIVTNLLRAQQHDLTDKQIGDVCARTEGFSGADMDTLCREAAFGPIREITDFAAASVDDVRPIGFADFEYALTQVRPSVSPKDLEIHIGFNRLYGMSEA